MAPSKVSYPDLQGKTFAVTGGASGIGRGIALLLADQGSNVALLDLKAPDQLAKEIEAKGVKALAIACDVQSAAAVNAAFKQIEATFGSLDGAANFAGISAHNSLTDVSKALDIVNDDVWDKVIGINLTGVKNCLREEIRLLKGKGGPIINAGSLAARQGDAYGSPYNSSKWAVLGLSKCAAQEWGPHNIRVNTVSPGIATTPLTMSMGSREVLEGLFLPHIAMKRLAEPDEISKVVVFLLSDEAGYINGADIQVDGGWR